MLTLKQLTTRRSTSVTFKALRGISTSRVAFGDHLDHGHEHEHSAPEEKLGDNPLYLGTLAAMLAGATGVAFDEYYKKSYGESYFGQFIRPVQRETILADNRQYQERTMKDAQVYEVMYTQPVKSVFRDLEVVQPIARGSVFNREPGTSMDVDTLSARREPKRSIFD